MLVDKKLPRCLSCSTTDTCNHQSIMWHHSKVTKGIELLHKDETFNQFPLMRTRWWDVKQYGAVLVHEA